MIHVNRFPFISLISDQTSNEDGSTELFHLRLAIWKHRQSALTVASFSSNPEFIDPGGIILTGGARIGPSS